jgi:hypothetical protein
VWSRVLNADLDSPVEQFEVAKTDRGGGMKAFAHTGQKSSACGKFAGIGTGKRPSIEGSSPGKGFRIPAAMPVTESECGTASGKCRTLKLGAEHSTSRMLGMDYDLRSAPTIATEITHFSEDRLCQAWRVPF